MKVLVLLIVSMALSQSSIRQEPDLCKPQAERFAGPAGKSLHLSDGFVVQSDGESQLLYRSAQIENEHGSIVRIKLSSHDVCNGTSLSSDDANYKSSKESSVWSPSGNYILLPTVSEEEKGAVDFRNETRLPFDTRTGEFTAFRTKTRVLHSDIFLHWSKSKADTILITGEHGQEEAYPR